MEKVDKKPEIRITPTNKYTDHVASMLIMYGDCYVDWYKEEGCKLFFKWAEKRGIKFIEAK